MKPWFGSIAYSLRHLTCFGSSKEKSLFGRDVIEIEDKLYLGNKVAVNDLKSLQSLDIKYVLSVFDKQVRHKCPTITYFKIPVVDSTDEEILSHFMKAIEFIGKAQESGQSILIHCSSGYSRSATIVMAFLMNKYRKSYTDVHKEVKKKRYIGPNNGFIRQLRLFEQMGYTLDANNPRLRQHLMCTLLNDQTFAKKWSNELQLYFTRLDMIEKMTPNLELGSDYRCSKCDHKLFNEIHVICNQSDHYSTESCDYVYIEPQKWMIYLFEITRSSRPSGQYFTVNCPQCDQQLVNYNCLFKPFKCDANCARHTSLGHCMRFRIQQSLITKN